jgi:hypothetical protein
MLHCNKFHCLISNLPFEGSVPNAYQLPLQPLLSSGFFFLDKAGISWLSIYAYKVGPWVSSGQQAHFAMPTYWLWRAQQSDMKPHPPRFSGVMTFAIRPSNNENRKCTSLEFQENEITLSSQQPPTEHSSKCETKCEVLQQFEWEIRSMKFLKKNGLTLSLTQHSSKCETKWKLHPFVVVSSFQAELNLYKLQTRRFCLPLKVQWVTSYTSPPHYNYPYIWLMFRTN